MPKFAFWRLVDSGSQPLCFSVQIGCYIISYDTVIEKPKHE